LYSHLILQQMIEVRNIMLTQFRNYLSRQFNFTNRIVAIYGENGSGKTNLLDALYFLCFTKTYFSKPDAQSNYQGLQGFRIEAAIAKNNEPYNVTCILRENGRKEFLLNGEAYKKFSEHIGKFPCVFIAPDDIKIITEGSESRRNFIDTIISQLNPAYLHCLIGYKKILDERNSLLKAATEKNYFDETLLDILDEQLIFNGQQIFTARNEFLQSFLPGVFASYTEISGTNDNVSLSYFSQLQNISFKELLTQNRQRDLFLQRTGSGVHKDDLEIFMHNESFKNMASQGQRKSLLFALKLAEFNVLKEKKKFPPLLLLDDVFEKLDPVRMSNLLHKVCVEENGQVFITDTHKERLQQSLQDLNVPFQLIELKCLHTAEV
jgi:DNA replication and repair protein RecF